ncbi:MAG TPA: BTAD domain-containing putative transcriptional regulator, partial [Mycobacteriales bacterium]|nr:BTAD domain-containing putative transcriptional regulator [Mycobacteriales bacterium]
MPDRAGAGAPFRIGILGQLTIWTAGGTALRPAVRQRLVLAALAVAEPAVVSTEELGDLIWGERRPATWIAQVHNVVRGLRRSLAAADPAGRTGTVRTDGAGYCLDLTADALDLHAFRRLVTQAESSAGPARLDRLRAAEALWRGPALADLRGTGLAVAAHRLDQERLSATQVRLELELDLAGRAESVVAEAGRVLAEHPWLERVHGVLMTGLWRLGRGVEAADHYRRLRADLSAELGIEPAAYLRALHSRILANDLVDGGRTAGPPAPHQLPAVPGDVVGRDELVAGIVADCAGQADRLALLALHGPPGIGKTTTALLVAARLAGRHGDGELFLRMRDARGGPEPAGRLLGRLIVGVDPAVPVPADPAAREGLWRTMTAGRRLVVVLDDAPDESSVRPLLPAPGNAVVVTSIPSLPGLESAVHTGVPALPDAVARAWLSAAATAAGGHGGDGSRDTAALDRIVATCAGSPLALRIVAARLATHAHESVGTAAAALSSPDTALDWLVAGDLAVAKSLRYAARDMAPEVLRGLGLLAACGFVRPAPWLAAALLGIGERQGRVVLERLAGVGLLSAEGAGVFGMHGLVQELARRLPNPAGDAEWRRLGARAARLARRAQQRTAGPAPAPDAG